MPIESKTAMAVRITFPTGEHYDYYLKKPQWDLSIEDFKELCMDMAAAMGYHPDNIQETFND